MSHNDKIQDTETHFKIDPETRIITNESASNNTIVQYDHNSERFTFEIPRYVDGHDMSESTAVRVHYRNTSSNKLNQVNGVYTCDDLTISEESEDTMTFSWLLSSATTEYIGSLHFSIQFICLDGETIVYSWNTGIYKDIQIIESINNSEEVVTENVDAIVALKNELMSELGGSGVEMEILWENAYVDTFMRQSVPLANDKFRKFLIQFATLSSSSWYNNEGYITYVYFNLDDGIGTFWADVMDENGEWDTVEYPKEMYGMAVSYSTNYNSAGVAYRQFHYVDWTNKMDFFDGYAVTASKTVNDDNVLVPIRIYGIA